MKYLFGVKSTVILISTVFALSCASNTPIAPNTPNTPAQPKSYGSELAASEGESEILINCPSNTGTLTIYVDGALKQTMFPRDNVKLIVPDGQHTLSVDWVTKDSDGKSVSIKGEPLQLNAESKNYVFNISLPELLGGSSMLLIGKKVVLTQISANALSGGRATSTSQGIGGAVIRACEALIEDIPGGANIAVLYISSSNREMAGDVADEIEQQLFRTRKFTIVNRRDLDLIRTEHNLQMSGDVSDESAVSIGKLSGANVIITGSINISGASRTLRLRALNVTTGQVIAMPRGESF